jgi:hypothetical protein
MKNIKKILLAITVIVSTTAYNIHAALTFELFNKSDNNIRWILATENETLASMELAAGKKAYLPEEKNKIAFDAPDLLLSIIVTSDRNEHIYRHHILASGKTKYLTWNPAKQPHLYPQTGPLMGLMGKYNPFGKGKTESGLPLNNNVQSSQITKPLVNNKMIW